MACAKWLHPENSSGPFDTVQIVIDVVRPDTGVLRAFAAGGKTYSRPPLTDLPTQAACASPARSSSRSTPLARLLSHSTITTFASTNAPKATKIPGTASQAPPAARQVAIAAR